MQAFTPDVAAAPATSGVPSAARTLLLAVLSSMRSKSAPAARSAADEPGRTVPNLASSTGYMAWRS